MHKYPHSGGVILRELEERNLHNLSRANKEWIKEYREILRKIGKNKIYTNL